MKKLLSWKTTVAGIIAGLAMIFGELRDVTDTDKDTKFDYEILVSGLGMLGIGFFARDNKVTSEQVGAK